MDPQCFCCTTLRDVIFMKRCSVDVMSMTIVYYTFSGMLGHRDRLTKVAHFIHVKTTYTSAKLAKIYMSRIVCLHGVPKSIVSDRGTQFTSHFWRQLHESLGTRLEFSTAFHPQTDGQTERTNQI